MHKVEGEGFSLLLTLRGDSQGTVNLQARAVPRGELLANRIGLCLMHSMHAMGRALEVKHRDGHFYRLLQQAVVTKPVTYRDITRTTPDMVEPA